MGYFSNGTEGAIFEARFCRRCRHEDEEKGCPVMLAHLLYAYQECGKKSPAESILDLLITRTEGGLDNECQMFIPARTEE